MLESIERINNFVTCVRQVHKTRYRKRRLRNRVSLSKRQNKPVSWSAIHAAQMQDVSDTARRVHPEDEREVDSQTFTDFVTFVGEMIKMGFLVH